MSARCVICGARAYPGTAYLDGRVLCEHHYRKAVRAVQGSAKVVRFEDDPTPNPFNEGTVHYAA